MAGGPDALLGHKMASDGGGMRHLNAPFRGAAGVKALGEGAQASGLGSYDNVFMAGGEVFKFAVRAVPTVGPPPDSCIATLPSEWHVSTAIRGGPCPVSGWSGALLALTSHCVLPGLLF